ncbi:MAG: hypothetical protein V4538_15260 [Bacteroidota bacterium]
MALNVYTNLTYPTISVYVDLNRGSQTNSIWGIQILNDPPFRNDSADRYIFGTVTGINYLGTKVSVGQSVMIDRGQAILVTQGGINYYLADETTVLMTELPEE